MEYKTAQPTRSRTGLEIPEPKVAEIVKECQKRATKTVSVDLKELLKEIGSSSTGAGNSISWCLNKKFKAAKIGLKAGTEAKGTRLKFTIHKW